MPSVAAPLSDTLSGSGAMLSFDTTAYSAQTARVVIVARRPGHICRCRRGKAGAHELRL
jgi:hypothetical protein